MTPLERLTAALTDRYRVDRELGAGGMATVYLAHDLRHERQVAIKVLHPELGAALGGERFLGEIRTTARLQHPNILPLLDSGEADGLLYYVMPLVEGETLRDRLERERQLSLEAALRIATEVAEALGYAHRQQVIHRDIKPENILLHDGRPIVADFGIALAVTAASGSRMTQTGLSLGTPQYMAPEQAMGDKHIDARADIYALGAVTYEMLTGEPPFTGATVQAIVAKVLTERPVHPTSVRETVPLHVEATVLKALAKLPADRFETASAFANALHHAEATASLTSARARAEAPARGPTRLYGSRALPWGIAGLAVVAAAWAWMSRSAPPDLAEPPLLAQARDVKLAPLATVAGIRTALLSRDGTQLFWLGPDSSDVNRIFVAALDRGGFRVVPGTEGAAGLSVAPDGKTVMFRRGEDYFVVSVDGGQPRRLMAAGGIAGLGWTSDGWIVVARVGNVSRVRPTGGEPEMILGGPMDSSAYSAPQEIEESGALILARAADGVTELVALPRGGKAVTPLGIVAGRGAYARGVLVFVNSDGILQGVPFDPRALRTTGEARPLGEGSTSSTTFSLSATGLLAFAAQGSIDGDLMLVNRAGSARAVGDRRPYLFPRFSPSGTRVVVGVAARTGNTRESDLWSIDVTTGVPLRITNDGVSSRPAWAPDGQTLYFSQRSPVGVQVAARVSADGTTPSTTVAQANANASVFEFAPTADGHNLVWRQDTPGTGRDIFAMPVDTPSAVRPVLQTRFNERGLAAGPVGDWLAYVSNESGRDEVYIRRLAAGSPRWPVSRNGGVEPRWTRSGEVFFRHRDSVFVAGVTLGPGPGDAPRIAAPTLLFTGSYQLFGVEPTWDAAPDGQSFVMVRVPTESRLTLMLYTNWIERWKAAAPGASR